MELSFLLQPYSPFFFTPLVGFPLYASLKGDHPLVFWERLKADFVILPSILEQDLIVLIPPLLN